MLLGMDIAEATQSPFLNNKIVNWQDNIPKTKTKKIKGFLVLPAVKTRFRYIIPVNKVHVLQ